MILVSQAEPSGCGPACLAMVAGITYEEACRRFRYRKDFRKQALTIKSLDRQLVIAGFAIARRYREPHCLLGPPFAKVHIALVHPHRNERGQNHFVVMDKDGDVFDPAEPECTELSDYAYVLNIAGLYKIDHDEGLLLNG